ncbi:MAG: hypothetical protein P4M12_04675 [Gammaproteobacteria bacterium]|nr:hypothetical protein [Gammaproteobacteria bacterium]
MKKTKILLSTFLLLGYLNSYADSVCKDKYGSLRCESGTVKNIDYRGFVEVNNMTVDESCNVQGNANINNSTLNSLEVRGETHIDKSSVSDFMNMIGNVNANNITVVGKTDIIGNLYANHATLNSTSSILGSVDCDFCVFKNDVTLIGEIDANHSEFLRTLVLTIKKGTFLHSKMNDIIVKQASDRGEQVIQLKEGSSIHNIVFEGQKGVVILNDNSVITGKVQGGKVIKTT